MEGVRRKNRLAKEELNVSLCFSRRWFAMDKEPSQLHGITCGWRITHNLHLIHFNTMVFPWQFYRKCGGSQIICKKPRLLSSDTIEEWLKETLPCHMGYFIPGIAICTHIKCWVNRIQNNWPEKGGKKKKLSLRTLHDITYPVLPFAKWGRVRQPHSATRFERGRICCRVGWPASTARGWPRGGTVECPPWLFNATLQPDHPSLSTSGLLASSSSTPRESHVHADWLQPAQPCWEASLKGCPSWAMTTSGSSADRQLASLHPWSAKAHS